MTAAVPLQWGLAYCAGQINLKEGYMASTTTPSSRESHKKLKPKPKTESKSWQTRNMARKEKQAEHAAKVAPKTEA